jgi:hypothetical protein
MVLSNQRFAELPLEPPPCVIFKARDVSLLGAAISPDDGGPSMQTKNKLVSIASNTAVF